MKILREKGKRAWLVLGSKKTAGTLLILLILACIAGSLIPGNASLSQCSLGYSGIGRFFFTFFNLNDIYHSWWFICLLGILGLSLLRCAIARLKIRPRNIGSFITHSGLLIILLGALISAIFLEEGFMALNKGQTEDIIVLKNNRLKKLGFGIYLHDFIIERYPPENQQAKSRIKDFKSRVAVIKGNKAALTHEIKVNHPLKYNGYMFYQSGYDPKRPQWSGLEAVKDPGVPFVYCGFILLNLGILIIFYFKKTTKPCFHQE